MQETALCDASSIQEFFKWIVLTAIDLRDRVMDLWQKFMSSIEVAAPMCHTQLVHCGNVTARFQITELTTDGWLLCKSRKQECVSEDGVSSLKYLPILKDSVNQKLLNKSITRFVELSLRISSLINYKQAYFFCC